MFKKKLLNVVVRKTKPAYFATSIVNPSYATVKL